MTETEGQFTPGKSLTPEQQDRIAALKAEIRSAYLGGAMDENHPDL